MLVQDVPGDGVPTCLVGSGPLARLENQASIQQFTLGTRDNVLAGPATRLQVVNAAQQLAVVVTDILAGKLQQQRLGRMAQTLIGSTIQH